MQLVLTESRWLRFGSFSAFYFAQGVPLGLFVAITGWLAEHGVSEGQVASFVFWTGLPWALKLIAGPFMDRFTFLSMGFRRPWVIALQGGLVVSLLVLAAVGAGFEAGPEGGSLAALTAAGALVNTFAATQDVAVDGMAIDVLPEQERGRANAFMGFGQTAARSGFAPLCGALLGAAGIAAGAFACAIAVGAVFFLVGVLRERPGERLLPWSDGEAAPRPTAPPRMLANIWSVLKVLALPMSLVAISVEFASRVRDGMAVVLFPVLATQELGYSNEQWTALNGAAGFASAVLVVFLGPVIDRVGARRMLLFSLLASAATHLAAGLAPGLWQDAGVVVALYCLSEAITQLVFVSVIALFMNLCSRRVAATQFAVYMALANLARSAGAGLLALLDGRLDHTQELLLMAGLLGAAAALLLLFNEDAHKRRLAEFDDVAEAPPAAALAK